MLKFSQAELILNFLSLINVLSGFLFVVFLSKLFGLDARTDAVLASMAIMVFLLTFPQLLWEAIPPYFSHFLATDLSKAKGMYKQFLFSIIFLSLIILFLYFIFFRHFIDDQYIVNFLDVYIFFFLIKSVQLFNSLILNLNEMYFISYLSEAFISAIAFFSLFFIDNSQEYAVTLAFVFVFAGGGAISVQFLYVFKRFGKITSEPMNKSLFLSVIKSSVFLKSGSLLYNLKDLWIIWFFYGISEGAYSLYSFAYRMASAIHRVANAPILSVFVTNINNCLHLADDKRRKAIYSNQIKEVIVKTVVLFAITAITVYLMTPVIGSLSSIANVELLKTYFFLSVLFYLAIVIFYPFYHVLVANKRINIILFAHVLFILSFSFLMVFVSTDYSIFIALIFSQLLLGLTLFFGVRNAVK